MTPNPFTPREALARWQPGTALTKRAPAHALKACGRHQQQQNIQPTARRAPVQHCVTPCPSVAGPTLLAAPPGGRRTADRYAAPATPARQVPAAAAAGAAVAGGTQTAAGSRAPDPAVEGLVTWAGAAEQACWPQACPNARGRPLPAAHAFASRRGITAFMKSAGSYRVGLMFAAHERQTAQPCIQACSSCSKCMPRSRNMPQNVAAKLRM